MSWKDKLIIVMSILLMGCFITIYLMISKENEAISKAEKELIRSQERVKGLELSEKALLKTDSINQVQKDSLRLLIPQADINIANTEKENEEDLINILLLSPDSALKFFSTGLSEADTLGR